MILDVVAAEVRSDGPPTAHAVPGALAHLPAIVSLCDHGSEHPTVLSDVSCGSRLASRAVAVPRLPSAVGEIAQPMDPLNHIYAFIVLLATSVAVSVSGRGDGTAFTQPRWARLRSLITTVAVSVAVRDMKKGPPLSGRPL